ncbi:MAG: hypothetical protein KC731_04520 [Myxococcales bacterium]|nr:hypothetical protein [Myxococcales bacterium]
MRQRSTDARDVPRLAASTFAVVLSILAPLGCQGDPVPAGVGGAGSGGSSSSGFGGELTGCEGADFASDPFNCGACGRVCVIPNASAACVAGECAMAACDTGFSDCDGVVDNGCEVPVECDEGATCATACNSAGTISCDEACNPQCVVPAETCNVVDDDCNGQCDDGAIPGCRVGVHRVNGTNGHYYTTDLAEAQAYGNVEAQNYFYLYADDTGDLRPFFRCNKSNGKTFMTTSTDCEATGAPLATVGFISATEQCGATPLHRLLNGPANAHFYTTSAPERDNAINNLGFTDQGVAGWVFTTP